MPCYPSFELLPAELSKPVVATVVVFFTAGIYHYLYWKPKQTPVCSNNSSHKPPKTLTSSPFTGKENEPKISNENDVVPHSSDGVIDAWEERRQRGISIHSLHEKKDVQKTEKPFGSSYYYAHNNTQAKGGYADGLRMEDYTMNKPRLLSQPSGDRLTESTVTLSTRNDADTNVDKSRNAAKENKRVLLISKYLWDDPGNSNGEATIRIEQLPRSSTESIAWEDAKITASDIRAELLNHDEGLLIVITREPSTEYRLQINKLYGPITAVKTVSKQKRLIIKIYKKYSFLDRSNLKSWPHPQKKNT